MLNYLTYTAAIFASASSMELEGTYQSPYKNDCGIPEESVQKLRDFENYARNFDPVLIALSTPGSGLPESKIRRERCCTSLTKLFDEPDDQVWYEGEVECDEDG